MAEGEMFNEAMFEQDAREDDANARVQFMWKGVKHNQRYINVDCGHVWIDDAEQRENEGNYGVLWLTLATDLPASQQNELDGLFTPFALDLMEAFAGVPVEAVREGKYMALKLYNEEWA